MVAGLGEQGMESYCLMVQFQFGKMKEVLGLDGDDGYITMSTKLYT